MTEPTLDDLVRTLRRQLRARADADDADALLALEAVAEMLSGSLYELSARQPDAGRAKRLTTAAQLLTGEVIPRLGTADVVGDAPPARAVRDTPPAPAPKDVVPGPRRPDDALSAVDQLVRRYRTDDLPSSRDPLAQDPGLSYDRWVTLHHVRYKLDHDFSSAPAWHDDVPHRGRKIRVLFDRPLGLSRAEVLRRMHHRYVRHADLEEAVVPLVHRAFQACAALRAAKCLDLDADLRDTLRRRLESMEWKAAVLGAENTEDSRKQLHVRLEALETLSAAVLALDDLHAAGHRVGSRITPVVADTKELLRTWPRLS
ncbi:hypothetical protein AB0M28_07970 [Streptomyces sp. NPDC051940]|uniref:hypothetical protein n=1 Tax=Streptomyces sp. NPDC051940 TaxID=3155675 RepID=UPI00341C60DD